MVEPFGFLNIDKPVGLTSHDIVNRIRRMLPRKTKTGHAGTLDPFATGVLVICVGKATRLAQYAQSMEKEYVVDIHLGATSTTDDIEGEISQNTDFPIPDLESIKEVTKIFLGNISQIPPNHSAVHIDGQRAYKLARAGLDVDIPAREVIIHSIDIVQYEFPSLKLTVRCGSGTYIRSLARDIGGELNCGGYCTALRRTAIGRFTTKTSVGLDQVNIDQDILPAIEYIDFPRHYMTEMDHNEISHGRAIPFTGDSGVDNEISLIDINDRFVAIGKIDKETMQIRPSKVFFTVE